MSDILGKVKGKIEQLNRRIETRSGENYHDESKKVLILEERLGVYEDLLPDISSLITTIDEEIEKQAEIIDQQSIANNYWHTDSKRLDGLNVMKQGLIDHQAKQIESLKAITELAVKGLKEIANDGIAVEESSHGELMEFIASLKKKLDSTLSEIERLSHE